MQFLRGDQEKHYQSENHQKAVLFCLCQTSKQSIEQGYTSAAPESNMEMETSDVSYKATTTTTTTSGVTEKFKDDVENLHETINILSSGGRLLKDELTNLNSESQQQSQSVETIDKMLPTIKTSIEETNNLLTAMHTNMQILQQDLSILKQKYDDQQVTSYDGTLVWKISQFHDKMSKNIQ
jgi:chromosome segregation ATPase